RDDNQVLVIRQQTLADLLGCSRRSIYRALKQLKEHRFLKETGKREKRCKVYRFENFFPQSGNVNIAPGVSPRDCVVPALKDPKGRLSNMHSTVPSALNGVGQTSPRANARGYILNPLRGKESLQVEEKPLSRLAKFHLDNCRQIFKYNFPESFDWEKFFPEATHKIRHVEHQTKFWRLMFDNLYLIQERETGKPHSARVDNPDSTLFGVSYPKEPPLENLEHRMRTRPAYRPLR
ncbi:MAG: winged helix-turn-helix domain-containing protein, partial [Deltaproteobacteria bacterium]|nr:winged helix-turn-helix domain-containing protein [Deltaproteobacteria bacterium]